MVNIVLLWKVVCSGVFLGLIVGLFFFILFLNDLVNVINESSLLSIVDDINLYVLNECFCVVENMIN